MMREAHLERLLENLELASANHLRDPNNDGARTQLRAALEAVRAFRRLEAAAEDLDRASEACERVLEPVPAGRFDDGPAISPIAAAEQTGRAGYRDD